MPVKNYLKTWFTFAAKINLIPMQRYIKYYKTAETLRFVFQITVIAAVSLVTVYILEA